MARHASREPENWKPTGGRCLPESELDALGCLGRRMNSVGQLSLGGYDRPGHNRKTNNDGLSPDR